MKVAIICEFSGTVRDAFARLGHEAVSFDLLPTETPGEHIQGDIQQFGREYWTKFDLAVCHPPCTHLAVSGAAWFKNKVKEQAEALDFVRYLMDLPIPRIALENPVSVISSKIRKPEQIIQPYEFGHMEQKKTCLWLKGLPKLEPTQNVYDEMMLLPKRERERECITCRLGRIDGKIAAEHTKELRKLWRVNGVIQEIWLSRKKNYNYHFSERR